MHLLPVEVFLWFLPARRQPAVCVSVCRVSAPWVHHECQSECEWVWVWVSLSASKREQLKVGLNSCKWVRDYVANCSQCLLLFTFISLFGRNCGNWRKWLPAAACHRFEFVFLCPCRGYTSFVMKYVTHRTHSRCSLNCPSIVKLRRYLRCIALGSLRVVIDLLVFLSVWKLTSELSA